MNIAEVFVLPLVFYVFSGALTLTIPSGENFWSLYVLSFPLLLILLPFWIYKHFKKVPFILLPFVVFIFLQILPLPRSPYYSVGAPGPSARNEPFAIGLGYPFSYLKLYLGNGCIDSIPVSEGGTICGSQYSSNPYIRLSPRGVKDRKGSGDIRSGDVVVLPEQVFHHPAILLGLSIYSYGIFLACVYVISRMSRNNSVKNKQKKKSKNPLSYFFSSSDIE